jgi:hypothetical protein
MLLLHEVISEAFPDADQANNRNVGERRKKQTKTDRDRDREQTTKRCLDEW